jgi:hypothetical protein
MAPWHDHKTNFWGIADWQTLASPLISRFLDSFYAEDRALPPPT